MKNLVVTVILVGVLGYFGAKFYLHHEVSTNLDATLDMIRPFADIQYDGVSSTMTGELSVDGISARFGMYKDRVDIDKVSIITPGFWYLLNLGDLGSSGGVPELPESFGFAIDGLRADVSDDFMKALAKAARDSAPEADVNDIGANCVGKYGFSMDTLRRLGYDDVVMSMAMGYRQDGGRLLVDISADIEDMYGMQIDLTLDGTITPEAVARGTFRPRMIDGRLEYEDYSLIERTRAHCRSEGLTDDEIMAAELDAFQAAGIESGIAFDEYVMIPYQKFLSGGSKFVLTASPNEPVSLSQIDLYKPEDVPALLNLSAETL
jgi:hypothetical protein